MKFDKKAAIEAAQEVGRIFLFAGVSAVVAWGLQYLGFQDQTDTTIILGTLALKFVDKYIHDNPNFKANGLTDTKVFKK